MPSPSRSALLSTTWTGRTTRSGEASGGSGFARGHTRARSTSPRQAAQRLRQVVGRRVEHQEHAVGVAHQVRHVGLGVRRGHGRRVHELHLHVLEGHHARLRGVRGEGIRRDLGMRVGEGGEQRRLAGVRRPDQDPLPRALAAHVAGIRRGAHRPGRRARPPPRASPGGGGGRPAASPCPCAWAGAPSSRAARPASLRGSRPRGSAPRLPGTGASGSRAWAPF